jgi:chromosome segregation ATPase
MQNANRVAELAKELFEAEEELERWREEQQEAFALMQELEKKEEAALRAYNDARSECTLLKNRMKQLKEELRLAVYDDGEVDDR